jgi:hypothetical protein
VKAEIDGKHEEHSRNGSSAGPLAGAPLVRCRSRRIRWKLSPTFDGPRRATAAWFDEMLDEHLRATLTGTVQG